MSAVDSLSAALQERFSRGDLRSFDRVLVVDQCGSTQDVAKQACEGRPGMLVIAERQTAGRGRLGRAWADTSHLGLPATFVLDPTRHSPELLSLIAGIAACATCEIALNDYETDLGPMSADAVVARDRKAPWLPQESKIEAPVLAFRHHPVALRWPNDVVERTIDQKPGRKLAGVLIERMGNLAFVGIGINVLHARADWSFELAGKATSLRELGSEWSRAHAAVQLVTAFEALLSQHEPSILRFWRNRDALTGRYRTFEHNNQRFTGTIKSIDPLNNIVLQLDDGTTKSLPALTTSLVHE